ncbi:MAG: glucosamine-6-phosphate deaminase [Propionicimonas sp.]
MKTVQVLPTRSAMGEAAATAIARILRERLAATDGLVRVVFAAAPSQSETLAKLVATDGVDWSRIEAFHMDEYLGLPDDHPSGFANWLQDQLFSRVPFHAFHPIKPGPHPEETAADYAELLAGGPLDLVVCGIGQNGHVAFNDPPVADFDDPLDAKVVELDDTCRQQQVEDGGFASLDEVPTHAITLTVPRLMRAAAIVCVVPDASKRAAVTAALTGPVTTALPASILRTHPNATFIFDQEAGADVDLGR